MEMKEEPSQYNSLFGFGSKWKEEWDLKEIEENVSINDESIPVINKARDVLKHTNSDGTVQKPHPLAGINLVECHFKGIQLRFVQLHLPPNEKDSTWKVRLAIGLDARVSKEYEKRFIEFFEKDNVCKAPSKRAPGIVHKTLMEILIKSGELDEETYVLGSSFYFDKYGGIDATNRSGQNVGYTKVNDLGRLCLLRHNHPLVDQYPIRISKKFSREEIEKALNGECVLLQQMGNKYYVHYLHEEKLKCDEIKDKTVLQGLSEIEFPEDISVDLTQKFVEIKGNDREIEATFNKIRNHLENKTFNKNLSKIPYFDTPFFVQGNRNIHKKLFNPLHRGTIKAINRHTKLVNKVCDSTLFELLDSYVREENWDLIINHTDISHRDKLVELMVYKTLLYISTEDLNTRRDRYEKHYNKGFSTGLDFLSTKINIYTDQLYPTKLSLTEEITNRCDKVKKGIGKHHKIDKLSINKEFPVWLSLYVTALRNRNIGILDSLDEKLLKSKDNDKNVTKMLISGFKYAHEKKDRTLYDRLINVYNKYNPELNVSNEEKELIDNPPDPKYSMLDILKITPLSLVTFVGTTITEKDYLSCVKNNFKNFTGAILKGLDFSKHECDIEGVKFNKVRLTSKQVIDLYNRGFRDFKGTILDDCDLRSLKELKNCDFRGASLKNVNLTGVTLTEIILDDAILDGCVLEEAEINNSTMKNASLLRATLSGAKLIKTPVDKSNFNGAILDDIDLTSLQELSGCNFKGASLKNAKLTGLRLTNVNLNETILDNALLDKAEIKNSNMSFSSLLNVKLTGTKLTETLVGRAIFDGSDLTNVEINDLKDLDAASFKNGAKIGTELFKNLIELDVNNFDGIDLTLVDPKELEHIFLNLDFSIRGIILTGEQVKHLHDIGVNQFSDLIIQDLSCNEGYFENIVFSDITFNGTTSFNKTSLMGVDFSNATFNGPTRFNESSLDNVNFSTAKFNGGVVFNKSKLGFDVNFDGVSIPQNSNKSVFPGIHLGREIVKSLIKSGFKNFSGSMLSRVDLSSLEMDEVDFTQATLDHVNFDNTSLRKAIFKNAKMRKSSLNGTMLLENNMTNCDVQGTSFSNIKVGKPLNVSDPNFSLEIELDEYGGYDPYDKNETDSEEEKLSQNNEDSEVIPLGLTLDGLKLTQGQMKDLLNKGQILNDRLLQQYKGRLIYTNKMTFFQHKKPVTSKFRKIKLVIDMGEFGKVIQELDKITTYEGLINEIKNIVNNNIENSGREFSKCDILEDGCIVDEENDMPDLFYELEEHDITLEISVETKQIKQGYSMN